MNESSISKGNELFAHRGVLYRSVSADSIFDEMNFDEIVLWCALCERNPDILSVKKSQS